jgi:YbgC/YbaW family acyl-CoA thioester hydrolase
MRAFYSGQFVLPLPAGHRFPMSRYAMLRDRLLEQLPAVSMDTAPRASDSELALAHTAEWIADVSAGNVSPQAMREIGFPWSEAMVERSRRSAGATIAACRVAFAQGVSANMAGGTHHAYAYKGSGFCVFNDAAVAARLMQAERAGAGQPLKVAVIDLDVHQGNGTASIFQDDPSVFTLSLHGQKNFPFRKEASDLDVELPDGCGDADYLAALEHALEELDRRFSPGLVIYLAGADPFERDRLGRLKLSFDGLVARDRRVFDWAWQRRLPVAFAMAGRLRQRHRRDGAGATGHLQGGAGLLAPLAKCRAMSATPTKPTPHARAGYRAFRSIPTRWADNDMYGHVNNVVYYSWFDTAVNALLIERGALDIHGGQTIGFVVETQCNYFAPIAFPQTVEAGIRVAQAGRSSVRYEIALFAEGSDTAAAQGHFVHVYVDRATQRPVPLPDALQQVVDSLKA